MRYLLLLPLLLACDLNTGPTFSGVPFTPDPSWRTDWAAMEACSGRTGDFNRIEWLPSPDRVPRWESPHFIYLQSEAVTLNIHAIIQHEILHDLLRGDVNHTSPLWAQCAPQF